MRKEIKAGDILFVRGKSLISRIIRLFDKGEFSHVAIAVSDTHILEAQYFTHSRITPIYFDDYEIISIDLTEEELLSFLKISIGLTGKRYDFLQIIGYVINRKMNNPNHYICTEMIAILLYKFGRVKKLYKYNYLKPNQLYRTLSKVLTE